MTDEAQMKAFTEACQNYEARLAEQRQYIEALELVLYKRSHVMEKDMAEALEMTMAERDSLRSQLDEALYRAADAESHCTALSEDVSRLKRDLEFAQCGLEDLNEVIDGLQGKAKAFDQVRTIVYRGKIDNADQAWDRLEDIVWVVNEVTEDE